MDSSETLLMSSVKLGEGLQKQASSRRSSQVTRGSMRSNDADDFISTKPLTTKEALIRLHDDLEQEVDRMKVSHRQVEQLG